MGRPKLATNEGTDHLGFTVPQSVADEFKRRAEALGLSKSEYFRKVFSEHVTREPGTGDRIKKAQ